MGGSIKYISIDQSLSGTAYIVWEGNVVLSKGLIKTGSTGSKGKKCETVNYFNTVEEQIEFVADKFTEVFIKEEPEHVILETLSFGSLGSATRNLAGLYHVIVDRLLWRCFSRDNIHTVPPTKAKAYARNFLEDKEQLVISSSGKVTKVKMDKKLMVKACNNCDETIVGNRKMSGKNGNSGDLADAYFIGKSWYSEFN